VKEGTSGEDERDGRKVEGDSTTPLSPGVVTCPWKY